MERVIVVPFSDAARFPDLEVIARDRSLAELVGDTVPRRARKAYDSEDSFLEAAALGIADRYTFDTHSIPSTRRQSVPEQSLMSWLTLRSSSKTPSI